MRNVTMMIHITVQLHLLGLRDRLREEAGEGVISTGIAVLITALLGAAMWVAFRGIFDGAAAKTGSAVNAIGG